MPPNRPPPDAAKEDLPWITERRMHHPIKTLEQPFTLTQGALTLPRDYILCTKNEAFRPYANRATEVNWPVHGARREPQPAHHDTGAARRSPRTDRAGRT